MNTPKQISKPAKLICAMATIVFAFVLGAICLVGFQADRSTRSLGRDTAHLLIDQFSALRSFHEAVVEPGDDTAAARRVAPAHPTAIHLQANEFHPGATLRLYSNMPFTHRGVTRLDAFQQAALDALEADPDAPFHRMEQVGDHLTMRYAITDVMGDACVRCHNSHATSPKTDWKIGDVRGVVEVAVPVDRFESALHRAGGLAGIVMLIGSCLAIGLSGFVTRRLVMTLRKTFTTVSGTSSEIAAAVESNHRIASDQSIALTETMTTMEQLGESSRLSASQAVTGAEETSQSLILAEDGAKTVQRTLETMSDLKQDVSRISHEIAALSERIDRIGEISTFVGDLANQTNLLAMNAAVEAAHAGQHGQGFAVVATEIRKLADQSTKSVSRIRDLVMDIQQATHASVLAAEEGQVVVDQTTMLAEQTAEAFERLRMSVSKAAESVQQLSLNNREQATGIDQVVEAVESLSRAASLSVAGLQQTGASLEALEHAVQPLREHIGAPNAN